jgi:hypothetical protein
MVAYVQFRSPALFCRQNAAFCELLADGDVLDGLVDVPSANAPPVRPMIAIAAPRIVIRIAFPPCESSPSRPTGAGHHSSGWNTIALAIF